MNKQLPKSRQWFIINPDFKKGKCENPNNPNCGQSDKLLWIKTERVRLFATNKLYVCAKCAKKDFELVGLWANTWEKEFPAKQKDFKNYV